jgi:hypothetical protein
MKHIQKRILYGLMISAFSLGSSFYITGCSFSSTPVVQKEEKFLKSFSLPIRHVRVITSNAVFEGEKKHCALIKTPLSKLLALWAKEHLKASSSGTETLEIVIEKTNLAEIPSPKSSNWINVFEKDLVDKYVASATLKLSLKGAPLRFSIQCERSVPTNASVPERREALSLLYHDFLVRLTEEIDPLLLTMI